MDIVKRIDELRISKGWSKNRLATGELLTQPTISSMYARNTPPRIDILECICEAFGMTLLEFFEIDKSPDIDALTEHEKDLIRRYRELPDDAKKYVVKFIETLK